MVLADYAAYRWPKTQIILLTPVGAVFDGSLFNYCPNFCVWVPAAIGADDLASLIDHYSK